MEGATDLHEAAWSSGPHPPPSGGALLPRHRTRHRTRNWGRPQPPAPALLCRLHRPWALASSHRQQLQASEDLPPLTPLATETTRMWWAPPGWGGTKLTASEGVRESHSVTVVSTSNQLGRTKACRDWPRFPHLNNQLQKQGVSQAAVCPGRGWSTRTEGGQDMGRERKTLCAAEEWGPSSVWEQNSRPHPGSQAWGRESGEQAAGGGPWGEEEQQQI